MIWHFVIMFLIGWYAAKIDMKYGRPAGAYLGRKTKDFLKRLSF